MPRQNSSTYASVASPSTAGSTLDREPADHAVGDEPVDPALDGGGREPDDLADVAVAGAGVLAEQVDDAVIQIVHRRKTNAWASRRRRGFGAPCAQTLRIGAWNTGFMTITDAAAASDRPHRDQAHRAHVPPRALHRELPDQPVDAPGGPDRHRARRAAVGGALRDLPRPRLRGRAHRPDRRPARHGLRGQRRLRASTASPTARTSPTRSASPRARPTWTGSATTASTCASRSRSTRARATSCSSATSSSPAPASAAHPTATTRSRASSAARSSRCSSINPSFYHLDTAIAVLDPTTDRNIAYLPSAFDEPSLEEIPRALPGCGRRHRGGRGRARPQLVQRRLQRRDRDAAPRTSSASCASAATTRSASTCPSCSSAAAA